MGEYNKIAKKPLVSFATNGTVNLYTGRVIRPCPVCGRFFVSAYIGL